MKKLLLLAMMLDFLGSGCYATSLEERRSKSYWMKDGKEVLPEQVQRDYQECRCSAWVKDGMTKEDLEKDYDFCVKEEVIRGRHVDTINIWVTSPIPAEMLIPAGYKYFKRCMESKGYKLTEKKNVADQCMKDKGYEWVEGARK